MKQAPGIIIIFLYAFFSFKSSAQTDCNLDFVYDLFEQNITFQALNYPEGTELEFTIDGSEILSTDDVLSISIISLLQPVTICVSYSSSNCPNGVEVCHTLDISNIINVTGDGCIWRVICLSSYCLASYVFGESCFWRWMCLASYVIGDECISRGMYFASWVIGELCNWRVV